MKISKKQYAKVSSIADWKALPYNQRHKWGFWYIVPYALPMDLWGREDNGWNTFNKFLKMKYPIQYRVRELVSDLRSIVSMARLWLKGVYHHWFDPYNETIRNVLPKSEWHDLTSLSVLINLAIIQQFWEETQEFSFVDWEADEEHFKFYKTLEEGYYYAKYGRDELLEEIDAAHPKGDSDQPYSVLYMKVNVLEKQLRETDDYWMRWLIDNRGFMWT